MLFVLLEESAKSIIADEYGFSGLFDISINQSFKIFTL